eukprot:g8530.t1
MERHDKVEVSTNIGVLLTPVSKKTLTPITPSVKSLLQTRRSSITSPKALRSFNNHLLVNKLNNEHNELNLHEKINICAIPWCNCSVFLGGKDADCHSCGHSRDLHCVIYENDNIHLFTSSDEISSSSDSCEADFDEEDWGNSAVGESRRCQQINFRVDWHFLWHLEGCNQDELVDIVLKYGVVKFN